MSDEPTPGRLIRDLQPSTWTLDGEGWYIRVSKSGSEYDASLYVLGEYLSREFAEAKGATKQEALDALRHQVEANFVHLENALSFEWKA